MIYEIDGLFLFCTAPSRPPSNLTVTAIGKDFLELRWKVSGKAYINVRYRKENNGLLVTTSQLEVGYPGISQRPVVRPQSTRHTDMTARQWKKQYEKKNHKHRITRRVKLPRTKVERLNMSLTPNCKPLTRLQPCTAKGNDHRLE